MNWICKLLTNTTFLTIIAGVGVFVLGQLFMEYVLKPLQRYRSLRAKAAYCLTFYGNCYDLNVTTDSDVSVELRKMAAELVSYAIEKPMVIFSVRRKHLKEASACFVGLSNSVSVRPDFDFINEHETKIRKVLRLHKR